MKPDAKPGTRVIDQDRLLEQIRQIRLTEDKSSQGDVLTNTFQELFKRCASPASTRIDLDDLGQWINTAKSLLTTQSECLHQLLDTKCQSQLVQIFWEKLEHERAAVAKRAEPTLHSLLALLKIMDDEGGELSHLANLLLDRATQDIETRTSLVIYDVMLSVYDASVVLTRYPSLYSDLIHKFSSQVDIPTRRSRVCMRVLRSKGEELGLKFDLKAIAPDAPKPSHALWTEWSQFAILPMKDALLSHDLYKRNSTSVYHLTELFQLAPASVVPLVSALLAHPDPHHSLPAILGTLRAAKQFGLCRVATKSAHALEALLGKEVQDLSNSFHDHPIVQPVIVAPPAILAACIHASIEELQVAALSIVVESRSPIAPISQEELSVLHAFLQASFSSTHASGRGSLNSLFGRLLVRMSGIGYAAEREIAKLKDFPEAADEVAQHKQALKSSRGFVQSAATMILDALHPGAPYYMVIASLTFLELMLNAGVDPSFKRNPSALKSTFGKFAQEYSLNVPIINARTVRALLSCADSTYDDIQVRALGILHSFPAPLPGLEDRETAERAILLKAKELLLSGRDSESTAAGSLLRVYQQVYIRRLGWMPTSLLELSRQDGKRKEPSETTPSKSTRELALFTDLLSFLEAQIAVAENQGLLAAAKSNPVHGSFITLQKMLDDDDFWVSSDSEFQGQVRTQFLRAQPLIDRVWKVAQPILCAAAPEGNSHESGEGADTADTEVARAIAAAEGSPEGVMSESVIRKSQVMLSYSWRGMKEAAALLGKLVSSPMKKDVETAQAVWKVDEVESVGTRFTEWMTAVRHRGAFSTIYPAYSSAAAAILRCRWPEVNRKPHQWLSSFISKVTSPDNRVSTTRRSAGVGYAVLALVTATPLRPDRKPLDSAVEQLVRASDDCFGDNDEQVAAAHIHAINILRVLVLDSSLAESMYPHVDTLLTLAIRRFQSPVWYIRNAGLMLFSALAPRIFPARKTNEDDTTGQLPANRFFQMYPTLYDTLTENLRKSLQDGLHQSTNAADAEKAGSLYAVLFTLSRTQAIDHQESGTADLLALRQLVGQCLGSTDFKIREIAARAFGALTSPSQATATCTELLQVLPSAGENTRHGNLLALNRIVRVHGADGELTGELQALEQSETARGHSPDVLKALRAVVRLCLAATQGTHAVQDEEESIDALRAQLWDEEQDFQVRTNAADALYERYDEVDAVKVNISQEWERAASLAMVSERVPLREAVLALLGHLTGSVLAETHQDNDFKLRAVTTFSRLACFCSREDGHVESRLAAAHALSAFGSHLFNTVDDEVKRSRPLFNARIAVTDLLQDDDEEVRGIAAELIAKSLSGQSKSADEDISASLLRAARSAVASSTICTEKVWDWMNSRYGLDSDNYWTKYLSRVILPLDSDVQKALHDALNPSLALFAAERPNLFRDREMDVLRAYRLLKSSNGTFLRHQVVKRTQSKLQTIEKILEELLRDGNTLRFVTGRLLAVRLCLTVEITGESTESMREIQVRVKELLDLTL
ncbi:unnamed protein product [Sympodiomycopsis kandeliae]